jgi:NADH-quinone oxidoreductase subunit J
MPSALTLLLVLGAVGLFLAMPGGRSGAGRVGLVLLAAAGGVLFFAIIDLAAGERGTSLFVGGSLVALFAAVRVITHRKPVYSALYFVLLVVAVAGLLVLMQAEFLAAALLIVYAGAILVTYVFVIMLAQQARQAAYDARSREPFWGCLGGFALLSVVAGQLFGSPRPTLSSSSATPATGTVEAVGTLLLTQYVVAIQLVGLLLLAALVGAIAIARRRVLVEPGLEGED